MGGSKPGPRRTGWGAPPRPAPPVTRGSFLLVLRFPHLSRGGCEQRRPPHRPTQRYASICNSLARGAWHFAQRAWIERVLAVCRGAAETLWAGHKRSDLDLEGSGATEGFIQRPQGSALRLEDGGPGRWEWVWAAGLPSAHPEGCAHRYLIESLLFL